MSDEQREIWNGPAGRSWVAMQERLTAMFAPVTDAIVAAATPRDGDRVLDVGCGSGDTTLAFAAGIAPRGHATGVDISSDLVALARRRAEATAATATFIEGDAATLAPAAKFDLVVSRFGVMFFDDPVAAFANLHAQTRPGGRLVAACWRSPRGNPWATVPLRALEGLTPAAPSADPHAPGPFAFADADRVSGILQSAGWRDFAAVPFDFVLEIGDGPDPVARAVDFMLTIGPAARAVREAGPAIEPAARAALAAALAPYTSATGVGVPAAVWLLSAAA